MLLKQNALSRWWFQIFFIFTPTWGNDSIWLIFFRWVETTNQVIYSIKYLILQVFGSSMFRLSGTFSPQELQQRLPALVWWAGCGRVTLHQRYPKIEIEMSSNEQLQWYYMMVSTIIIEFWPRSLRGWSNKTWRFSCDPPCWNQPTPLENGGRMSEWSCPKKMKPMISEA